MKHSTHESSGLSARRLRSGAAGLVTALMLVTLVPPAAATDPLMVNEDETTVLAITLPYGGMTDVRYALRTEDGSAKAGVDYAVQGHHVVFPALSRTALVTVRTYPDEDSDNEHFSLVLSDLQTRKRGKWKKAGSRSWATAFLPASKKVRVTIVDTVGPVGWTHEDENHGTGE